ncbi:MAG TPA: tetratricopeptide repeat protein [Chitinophagaceae bacterium]|nr:tetratricopeptide repeat protein [Chitinophagaceae bacterium]MCB9056910.1 tetratricopeptide repeat protein [Chitinophagales bacterium]HPG12248.1 tetratricopeptide repeat protein [Chitinophagaceae bacterium]
MDNSTHNNAEKLIRYLDGELNEAEKQGIEAQLASDKALKEELDSLLLAREAVKQYGLQQRVASVHQEMMATEQAPVRSIGNRNRFVRYSLSIAAGIILVAGLFFAYNFFTISSSGVFSDNYQAYELPTFRGDDNNEMPAMEKAFREKKYTEVVQIDPQRPFTASENFYRGMAFIELKNDSAARASLQSVVKNTDSQVTDNIKDAAEYYLALVCIRHKDYKEALEYLQKIRNNDTHTYHERVSASMIRKVKFLARFS